LRQAKVEADYQRGQSAKKADKQAKADASMWRNTQKENQKDNEHRAWLFYTGVVLVVLGFIFQLLGSWPYGFLGFKSC
jgi:hypothetical protein